MLNRQPKKKKLWKYTKKIQIYNQNYEILKKYILNTYAKIIFEFPTKKIIAYKIIINKN